MVYHMLTIGKIAKLTQVSVDAILHYEKEGLLKANQRSESGYRLYDEAAVARIHFIKHAKSSGFSLQEIKELLNTKKNGGACCNDIRNLAIHKKLNIENKIKSLQEMSASLDYFMKICDDGTRPIESCPILAALERFNHG